MLRGLAREADVGERDRVAVAIAAGGGVFEVRFECDERGRVPMLAPFDTRRLIELEFVFQIFTYARHDQRVRIAGDDLCESPHTRAAPSVARQQRRVRMRLVEIFDDRQRLEQDRSFAVDKREAPSSG